MARQRIEEHYKQSEMWQPDRYEGRENERLRARVIASFVDPQVESVLDVGCGNGFVTRRLRAKRVVGLEPSEEALAHFEGNAVIGTSDDLPFEDSSFDTVVCAMVLEHLTDDVFAKTIKELDRVARASLVLGVPYRQDLREGMTRCADCGTLYHIDLHRRTFKGPKDLLALFPNFSLEAVVFLDHCQRIRSGLYRQLQYRFLGPSAGSVFARCPKCGSGNTVPPRKGVLKWFCDGLDWRMKRATLWHWMIVLLKRGV